MSEYDGERWLELYRAALVELQHARLEGLINDTRLAIIARVEKLEALPGLHAAERHAITDALSALRVLEREEERHEAEERQKTLDDALHKLKAVEPFIRRIVGEGEG